MTAIKGLLAQGLQYFQGFSVADALDILIIAFVVYKVLGFIHRTKTARIARTLVFVFIVLWVSDKLQLHVINFVLTKAIEIGLLAVVVLFQPEIRRVLERFGKNKLTAALFSREGNSQMMEPVIVQTVLAATQMSKEKTGALIVFERDISLDDMMKTGTIINADVNAELLRNIFFDKSPLHDGAVIIKDGQIKAAGCMVPLSNNSNLSRDLGMRHRAGIGVSEQSDAVSVIVSEETGSIAFAVDGMLKRHLTPETFEKLLRNELIVGAEQEQGNRKKFRDMFKGNRNG